jgi:integrase
VAPRQKKALEAKDLARVIRALPSDLTGLRDRAVLLVGFGGAFRRSELVSLHVEDIRFTADGIAITLRRSKTDQEGRSRTVPVRKGHHEATCPIAALRAWLAESGVRSGPVCRSIDRWGRVSKAALSPQSVARIVKRAVQRVGLDVKCFAGHSLRAGFITSAAQSGARELAIQRVTGHRSLEVLAAYVRAEEAFEAHPAERLVL